LIFVASAQISLSTLQTGGFYNITSATSGTVLSSTSTTYNPDGTVASTTTTDGTPGSTPDASTLTTLYTYYPDGQQASVTEQNVPVHGVSGGSENLTTSYFYNSAGQQSVVIDPLGNVTSYEYDSLGQLIETGYNPVSNDGSSTLQSTTTSETYDLAGNKASETDQLGRTTDYKYDNAGDLIEVDQPKVTNPSNTAQMVTPVTKYVFDVNGNETSQTDANGNTTTYAYDENGNMLTEKLPGGQTETWTYDPFGRAATHNDFDNNLTSYSYDSLGRETGAIYSHSGLTTLTVTYTYDSMGRQSTIVDASGTTTYSYDADSNLTEVNTPEGIIQYGYNTLDQHISTWTDTTSTTMTLGETLETFSYDDLGRLSGMTVSRLNGANTSSALNTVYGYDGNGNKVYEADPNSDVTTYTYDSLNRLTGETVKNGGTTLYSVAYTLNADGTRATAAETEMRPNSTNATINTTWGYDAEDRLTSESISSSLTNQSLGDAYTYDLDGNRLKDVHTGPGVGASGTTTYVYNSDNELTSSTEGSTTTTYGYDANGSQTTTTIGGTLTQTDSYDVRNRLAKVVNSNGTTTYVYDDVGDLAQETTGSTTTYYLTDTQNPTGYAKPLEVRIGSTTGTPTTTYIVGDRVLAQANSAGAVSYLIVDGLDNTRALANASGSVTAVFNYDPFGDVVGTTYTLSSPPPTMFLFQQTMFDPASGLNIVGDGIREVQPGEGSFIEADPRGYGNNQSPITLNLHLLDGADTINMIDLDGHDFDLIGLVIDVTIDAGLDLLDAGESLYARYKAIQAFDYITPLFGGALEGFTNEITGPQDVPQLELFAIGFAAGYIQTFLATQKVPGLGASIGSALEDTINTIVSSHEKFTLSHCVEIVATSLVAGGFTYVIDTNELDKFVSGFLDDTIFTPLFGETGYGELTPSLGQATEPIIETYLGHQLSNLTKLALTVF
jgi:YD repeat-containing protein